ncbi:hypothetical protein G9A89_023038 [Geosiphon pyriformis]|nr:hypothetical protein G9A89_023038 [Geosiphon pyriformis]
MSSTKSNFFTKYQSQHNTDSSSTTFSSQERQEKFQNVPEIIITSSSPSLYSPSSSTSEKSNKSLSQESDFNFKNFSIDFDQSNLSTLLSRSQKTQSIHSLPPEYDVATSKNPHIPIPIPAHLPASTPHASSTESLPSYLHATIDMPPLYPATKSLSNFEDFDELKSWPITKKLYVLGFLIWPIWFIGMGWCFFGRGEATRRWGKRCAWNSLVVIAIFAYFMVAYFRTDGRRLI